MAYAYITYWKEIGGSSVQLTIDLGTVTNISRTVSKKSMVTPIVSQPMRDAFPIESGNSQSMSLSFKRTDSRTTSSDNLNPTTLAISQAHSNKRWYADLTDAIDRWQAKTNGCVLHYVSDTPYIPSFEKVGYIKNISRTYKNDFNEVISGSLEFVVGTMYVNWGTYVEEDSDEPYSEMQVLMSNSTNNCWYTLMAGDFYNCISSVKITAGSESSFEYVDITIPKKKLMEFAPGLVGDIVYGQNEINMSLMGKHNLIVAKVDTDDDVLIRGYCKAWLYDSAEVLTEMRGSAWEIIERILTDSSYGVSFDDKHIIYSYSKDADESEIVIPQGDNVWRVLQICAIMLRCKIFFADDRAYIVDYTTRGSTQDSSTTYNSYAGQHGNGIEICRDMLDRPLELFTTNTSSSTYKKCMGVTKLGKEGIDTLRNFVSIKCSNTHGVQQTNKKVSYPDPYADPYRRMKANSIDLPELAEVEAEEEEDSFSQGTIFATNYLTYLREPQRSATFTLKEAYFDQQQGIRVWRSFFGPSARVSAIEDGYSGEYVDNRSVLTELLGGSVPQKLTLSSYTRKYPNGTCEYTFGTMSEISLPASTSQMNTSLDSKS